MPPTARASDPGASPSSAARAVGAAQAALEAVPVEMKVETELLSINLSYDSYAPCKKRIEELGALIEHEAFEASVLLQVRAEIEIVESVRRALADMTAGRALVETIR